MDARSPSFPVDRSHRGVLALRWLLLVSYGVVLGVVVAKRGFPLERAQVLAWVIGGLLISTVVRTGTFRTIATDSLRVLWAWIPMGVALAAYDLSRGVADTLGMPIQMGSLASVERFLFGGTIPTVWLQARVGPFEGPARWWEVPMTMAYLSHFVTAFAMLGVLWVRNRGAFRAFRRRFLTLTAAGLATYMLLPGAPPWMASERGIIGPVRRVGLRGLDVMGLDLADSLIVYGARFGNQVAALPSLHAGWATIIAWFLAERSPRWARPLLAAYPLWMGFSLVVAGEHYVVDVLLGYLYAGVIAYGWRLWERRSVEPVIELTEAGRAVTAPVPVPARDPVDVSTG